MRSNYFKWSNVLDWSVYLLTLLFVFEINIVWYFSFGLGCQDQDVSEQIEKLNFIHWLLLEGKCRKRVLDVACWVTFDDFWMAEPTQALHTASIFWYLHYHVWKHSEDHGTFVPANSHLYHCFWTRISHPLHQQCKYGKSRIIID